MPVSMMVVHTSTSMSPSAMRCITSLSWLSLILPWAVAMTTFSPNSCCSLKAAESMLSTRLWR